jgi:ERF superfamily
MQQTPSQWANGASGAPAANGTAATAPNTIPTEEFEYEPLPDDIVTIHERIAMVIKYVGWISKRGENKFNNYKYVIADDIIATLRPILDFYGLRVSFSEKPGSVQIDSTLKTAKGEPCTGAAVTLIMKITDVSSPQGVAEFSETSGYAVDKGDKALFKAKTGARKYGYIEAFELSIGDDPEDHGIADQGRQGQQDPRAQQQQQNRQGGQNAGQNSRQNPPSNQQGQQQQRPPAAQTGQNAGQAPPQGQGGTQAPRPVPEGMIMAIRRLLGELRLDEMTYMNQLTNGTLYAIEQMTFEQGNNVLTNLNKRKKAQEQQPTT